MQTQNTPAINRALYAEQLAMGKKNALKPGYELMLGDFVIVQQNAFKNDGGARRTLWLGEDCPAMVRPRLAKIEKIVNITFDQLDSGRFDFAPGGSQSDAVDDKKAWEYSTEDLATFYDLVTLCLLPGGRWCYVDAQGYNYPRYLSLPKDWRKMFTKEIAEEQKAQDERERQAQEHERQEREKARRECLEYCKLFEAIKPAKMAKTDVKNVLAILCPGVPVKLTQTRDYWGAPEITAHASAPHVSGLSAAWEEFTSRDHYYTGEEHTDFSDGYPGVVRVTEHPLNLYSGRVYFTSY